MNADLEGKRSLNNEESRGAECLLPAVFHGIDPNQPSPRKLEIP